MHRNDGLTLVELAVAIVILVTGILAAASMQASALGTTRRAVNVQQLTKLANAELELQRQFVKPAAPKTKNGCLSTDEPTYSCRITVTPCSLGSAGIICSGAAPTNLVAYQITIVVTGSANTTFTLPSLISADAPA